MIDRFYIYNGEAIASKQDKKLHAKQWGWKITILTILIIIGTVATDRESFTEKLSNIPLYSFNICLVIALFTTSFKSKDKSSI